MSTLPPVPESSPPQPPTRIDFDFARPFTFVFEDREWLPKILLGGLFYFASFFIIGIPFVMGYVGRVAKSAIAGNDTPLPGWDDLGGLFGEGIKLAVVGLVYMLPQFIITLFWVFSTSIAEHALHNQGASAFMGCIFVLFIPIFLLFYLLMPVALVRVVATDRMEAGFELPTIFSFITKNGLNFILAILVYLVAAFVAQFGVVLLCVGVIFTSFWAVVATAHAFGQVYRLSAVK